ncbi:VOC family protein [Phytohabitans rumicis]|nr:VOC family protein [Phytohabitans rumicis]
MMTNGIGWFEIATDDPATAERFYGGLFGWTFANDEGEVRPYRIVSTPAEASIRGGLFATGGQVPNYAVFLVVVADVEETCRRAEASGGKVLVPPRQADGGLVFAHLLDPAGNHFGVYAPGVVELSTSES